ncbi:MAG: hypothetical protein U0938_12830 [Thiobacillus sp.]|nr:hypothetical protein [Thiobacillus sp.]
MERDMSNVVGLAGFQCPVGSMAMHSVYGLVEVFSQDGWMRGVVYEHHEELSLAHESDDVIFAERIEMREVWVHVRDLAEADLAKDIENLRKRGQFLFDTVD